MKTLATLLLITASVGAYAQDDAPKTLQIVCAKKHYCIYEVNGQRLSHSSGNLIVGAFDEDDVILSKWDARKRNMVNRLPNWLPRRWKGELYSWVLRGKSDSTWKGTVEDTTMLRVALKYPLEMNGMMMSANTGKEMIVMDRMEYVESCAHTRVPHYEVVPYRKED